MTTTSAPEVGTPEWHADRAKGIGGSDVAGILGLSKYTTPIGVYNQKVGNVGPTEAGEAAFWGTVLEEVIAPVAADKIAEFRGVGTKIRRHRQSYVHPNYPFMRCNIDRMVEKTDELLEIKTAGAHMKDIDDWGPSFSDEVPRQYMLQVQHQLLITGRSGAWLAVLFGGQELRLYYIEPHLELHEFLIAQEGRFWEYVTEKIPPSVENGWKASAEQVTQDLNDLFKGGDGLLIPDDPTRLLAEQIHHAVYVGNQWEGIADQAKNRMRELMGEHSELELPGDEWILYRRGKDKKDSVDYKAMFEELAQEALAEEWKTKTALESIEKEHTTEGGKGNRPFKLPGSWKKEDTDGNLDSET